MNEINVPKIPLDASNDKVIAPVEKFSYGVRFNRIPNHCAWWPGYWVEKSNTARFVGRDTPVAWSST